MAKNTDLVTISVRLLRQHVEELRDLADALGTTPDALLGKLVGKAYIEHATVLNAECPWDIAPEAIEQARRLLGVDADRARDVLETAAIDAARAEQSGTRQPVRQGDGTLRYRGPKPQRLTLWVRPGGPGERDRLVRVNRSGAEHAPRRR
jgi:hypothetical protein